MPYKESEKAKARRRNREHVKRSSASDITAAQEAAMRKRARKCPLCGTWMTGKPNLPNSKHLDHIVPICMGGTHTHGNVRIICASCNLRRPRDGGDYAGPVTLWAQGPVPVTRPDRRRGSVRGTCRKGLHPWVPENIAVVAGKARCAGCYKAKGRRRSRLRRCKCGAMFAAPGNQAMCWDCITTAAREAAKLHAGGMSWRQVADALGCYQTAEGARFAAKRIGYVPAPRAPKPKPVPRCACGEPLLGKRGSNSLCDQCYKAKALEAMRLRFAGWTLRQIADQLGYSSVSSVTNLLDTVMDVERRTGRPPKTASPAKLA